MSSIKYIHQKNIPDDEENLSHSFGSQESLDSKKRISRWRVDRPRVMVVMVIVAVLSIIAILLCLVVLIRLRAIENAYEQRAMRPIASKTVSKFGLDSNVTDLQDVLTALATVETRQEKMENEIKGISATKIAEMSTSLSNYNDEVQNLQKLMTQVQANVSDLATEEEKLVPVSFSAGISTRFVDIGRGDIIPFDDVITDSSGHFNKRSHKYTCPVTGLYFFAVSVNFDLSGHYDGEVTLIIDGVRIFDILSYKVGSSSLTREQGSNSVVKQCSAGQLVWVEGDNQSGRLQAKSEAAHTVFTGFLLNAL